MKVQLTECVPHMLLCGWAAGKRSWLNLGWRHAEEAAQRSPGYQIRLHHIGLSLHCWPGHSHQHLTESMESVTRFADQDSHKIIRN